MRAGGKQQTNHLVPYTHQFKGAKKLRQTSLAMPVPLLLHHHRRRRLLLVLLVASLIHGGASDDDAYNASMCSVQPKACGRLQIKYPFYPSEATGVVKGTKSYCGYPGLAILCEDDQKPVIQLGGEKYDVTGINYDNFTFSVADSDVLKERSCPRADHNTTVPSASWLYLPPDSTDYLVFFLGCSVMRLYLNQTPVEPITCQGFDGGSGQSFVLLKDQVPPGNWSQRCTEVFEVPVLKSDPIDPSNPGWREGGYGDVLRQGFQLAWGNKPTPCMQCERSNGRCGCNETGGFVGCLCPDGRVNSDHCGSSSTGSKKKQIATIAGAAAGGGGALLIAGVIAILILKRKQSIGATAGSLSILFFAFWFGYKKYGSRRKSKETARIESFLRKNGTTHPKRYTYAQVKRMTKYFAEKLGQGGFGAVYRGDLSDGRQIAVKMLTDYKTDGEDFINEVASISRTSHINVVTLLGFCLEGSKRALIYDYMPNGSLERYAFKDNSKGENTLGWEKLFDIAVGIARGLEYLHRGCNTRIVHFDIKPHNILLDQDFCPKISDFGLAKLCLNKESAISIGVARGTIGYIAPEVYSKQFGAVSSKSDVYSYGMMVLEMVGARDKNINANSESSSQYFPQWIYDHLDDYCVSASEINGEITEIVRKMIVVGLWCIQLSATNRPTMTRVVEMLEGGTSGLELPPKVRLS